MMNRIWLWALVSILLNGVIFSLVIFIGDLIRHVTGPWYVYVGEGLFFGVVMTLFYYLKWKKTRKNKE